jgi:hypothetical protein
MNIPDFTHAELLSMIEYNPISGEFFRLPKPGRHVICSITKQPILVFSPINLLGIQIDGIGYRTLDIIWLYQTGRRAIKQLDRIDKTLRFKSIKATTAPNTNRLPAHFTQAWAKENFFYDGIKGKLYWRKTQEKIKKTGSLNGQYGDMTIYLRGKEYAATRIALWYMTGSYPIDPVTRKRHGQWDYRYKNLVE